MDVFVLDESYEPFLVIDDYFSLIWTDRFQEYGDFEMSLPYSQEVFNQLSIGNYFSILSSDRYMILESIELTSEEDNGLVMNLVGRDLTSILDRRVIYEQTTIADSLQNGIQKILNQNVISPTLDERTIPNFTMTLSTDTAITSLTLEGQYLGEEVYATINSLCVDNDIGFRVLPVEGGGFNFELYSGVDHSFDQEENNWVIFSPAFDNLSTSSYLTNIDSYKNVSMIAGKEDEDNNDKRMIVFQSNGDSDISGLNRREIYTDASSLSLTYEEEKEVTTTDDDGNTTTETETVSVRYSDAEYAAQLKQKGSEDLAEYSVETAFEGDVDAQSQFVYGTDFTIGDIVQIVNEYGIEAKARITEFVISSETDGETFVPTFEIVE